MTLVAIAWDTSTGWNNEYLKTHHKQTAADNALLISANCLTTVWKIEYLFQFITVGVLLCLSSDIELFLLESHA